MKIIVVGAGKIGVHIASELIAENRDVVLVEKDPETARVAANELDCLVINDDGSNVDVLRKAGIAKASWFLALTGYDETNIVSCGLVSAEYPGVRTVARVENFFYSSLNIQQKRALGLDILVNPAKETADAVASIIEEGFAENVIPLHGGQLQLRLVAANETTGFIGFCLREIKSAAKKDFLVAGVVREGVFEIPNGDFRIEQDDSLYILGTPEVLDAVLGQIANMKLEPRRIFIVGATNVTERLIERISVQNKAADRHGKFLAYLARRRAITVLDSSREDGKRLTRAFRGIEVSHGDCAEEGFLEQMHIEKADLVVCATESQSFNILTAQLAKSLGAKKGIAIALNERFMNIASSLDVDALVCVKAVVAASILALIRRANIKTIHNFIEDDVEIVELVITEDSPAAGSLLKDISLPKGALVGFIIKNGKILVPTGNTKMMAGDTVAFIVKKQAIMVLESAFGGSRGN